MTSSNETSRRSRFFTFLSGALAAAALAAFAALFWQVNRLDQQYGTILRDRAHYEAQRDAALERREALNADVAALSERKSRLEVEVRELSQRRERLEGEVAGLRTGVEDLRAERESLQPDMDAAQEVIARAASLAPEVERLEAGPRQLRSETA